MFVFVLLAALALLGDILHAPLMLPGALDTLVVAVVVALVRRHHAHAAAHPH